MNGMSSRLTNGEKRLVAYSKHAIIEYNKMRHSRGGVDTLYSFILSDRGAIYDGACFEPDIKQATICAERHAIANLVSKESYKAKIRSIVVADPVPEVQRRSTTPCGTCRHLIWQFGGPSATVILLQYIQGEGTWTFPRAEKYAIKTLYPHPYEPISGLWDGFHAPYRSK
jgi:cytidine deaminase